MTTRTLLNMTLPVLMLAGGTVAVASARDAAADLKAAGSIAAKATKALGKRDAASGEQGNDGDLDTGCGSHAIAPRDETDDATRAWKAGSE